jgi:hypothetical protein
MAAGPFTRRSAWVLVTILIAALCTLEPVVAQEDGDAVNTNSKIPFIRFRKQEHYTFEILFLSFLVLYAINLLIAGKANETLAVWWTAEVGTQY